MKIRIISVGKIKKSYLSEAIGDYLQRLRKYCTIEEIVLKDIDDKKYSINEVIAKESANILKHLNDKHINVVLDISGNSYDSIAFSRQLEKWFQASSTITLIIGGSHGVSDEIVKKCQRLSFSQMTFPHQLIKLFCLEQIYRSFKIKNNEEYHK